MYNVEVTCGRCGKAQTTSYAGNPTGMKILTFYCGFCGKMTASLVGGVERVAPPPSIFFVNVRDHVDQVYSDAAEEESYNYYRELIQRNEDAGLS